jgi:hypothetical protein
VQSPHLQLIISIGNMSPVQLCSGDDVMNLKGTTCDRAGGSMKKYWEKTTGKNWPAVCRMKGCSAEAKVGAHVAVNGRQYRNACFILPICQQCNKDPNMTDPNYAHVKATGTYAALREFTGTACFNRAR